MKKQSFEYVLTVICMLAAGICYSCSGGTNQVDLDGQALIADEQGVKEAGVQNGLISAETEAAEESLTDWGTDPQEGTQPWQTESVRLYVHICEEVKNPGVYEMKPGSRIFQAVDLAGGFTHDAASEYLNMAQETADGMKITVPSKAEIWADTDYGSDSGCGSEKEGSENPEWKKTEASENPGSVSGRNSALAGTEWIQMSSGKETEQGTWPKINLNTATREELMTLKGIGEAKAADIIRYREEQGPFRAIEEVMNISGIKEAAFQKIRDDITV